MPLDSATTRCGCCDLPVESCGKTVEERARKEAANERSQALARPGWFRASYAGFCGGCGSRFVEGDPIVRMSNGIGYGSICCCF